MMSAIQDFEQLMPRRRSDMHLQTKMAALEYARRPSLLLTANSRDLRCRVSRVDPQPSDQAVSATGTPV